MAEARYRPKLTDAGLPPTQLASAMDEYQNHRELNIADERPLTLYIDGYEIVTLMTIGSNPELLTLGYLKNQGLITDLREIVSVQVDWEVAAAAVTTISDRDDWQKRLGPRIVTTGCGQGTVFGDIMAHLNQTTIVPGTLKQSDVYALLKNLNQYNDVYKHAGAVHGCALCDGPAILVFVEDVGRHNAVDAIAGRMWLENISGAGKLFYTTGRLTSEMVLKVAQMGIPTLLSRSGITHMGLSLAREKNITLVARAQRKHFLVYNGMEYIEYDVSLPPKLEVSHMKLRRSQTV